MCWNQEMKYLVKCISLSIDCQWISLLMAYPA